MADTKITRLRNLMTPVVNYVALWKRLENMEKSIVNNESLQEKLTDIIADERKKMTELMPEIIEIVKSIPDNACGQEQNTSEKAGLLADVSPRLFYLVDHNERDNLELLTNGLTYDKAKEHKDSDFCKKKWPNAFIIADLNEG